MLQPGDQNGFQGRGLGVQASDPAGGLVDFVS